MKRLLDTRALPSPSPQPSPGEREPRQTVSDKSERPGRQAALTDILPLPAAERAGVRIPRKRTSRIEPLNLRLRASVVECASPLALWLGSAGRAESARGLAHSKTWRAFGGSWGVSTSEVRTRIAAMNRRLRIFVPGGTKICTAVEIGGSWVGGRECAPPQAPRTIPDLNPPPLFETRGSPSPAPRGSRPRSRRAGFASLILANMPPFLANPAPVR